MCKSGFKRFSFSNFTYCVLFSSLSKVLFIFRSLYLYTIGLWPLLNNAKDIHWQAKESNYDWLLLLLSLTGA